MAEVILINQQAQRERHHESNCRFGTGHIKRDVSSVLNGVMPAQKRRRGRYRYAERRVGHRGSIRHQGDYSGFHRFESQPQQQRGHHRHGDPETG